MRVISSIVALALVTSLTAAVLLVPETEDTTVIALILPLEDERYSHADEIEMAAEMAAKELNKWGGIGESHIRVLPEVVEQNQTQVIAAFERIEEEYHPLVYVTMSCGMMSMLSPIAEAASAPLIGMASALDPTEDWSWTYRYFMSIPSEVHSIMSLMQALNAHSLGILYTTSPHGKSVNSTLSTELVAEGLTVQSVGCPSSEIDYTDEVDQLLSNDAIFVMTSCEYLVGMLEAVEDSGFDGQVISASCGSSPEMRKVLPIDPVFMSAPSIYRPENMYAIDFAKAFELEFNTSLTHHGAISYDIVRLVHDLLKGYNATRADLKEQLDSGFVFTGVMGILMTDAGTHDFDVPVYPAVVSGGELSYL